MRHNRDSRIEERLIEDALAENMGRVEPTRDLWLGVRDRLSQKSRIRSSVLTMVITASVVAILITVFLVVRPWSLFDETITPFAAVAPFTAATPFAAVVPFVAVAHAYDGLHELETLHYRVDVIDSTGYQFVRHHQIDMVNRVHYYAIEFDTDLEGNPIVTEWITIGSKEYKRGWLSEGEWTLDSEAIEWGSLEGHVGLPWSPADAEERFDQVESIGNVEIDGRPAVHYRASKRSKPTGTSGYPVLEWDAKNEEVRGAETVHRGAGDHASYVDTVDLWITPDDGRLIKADWTQYEQPPARPQDFDERNWCEGLGEFVEAQYDYRLTSGPSGEVHIRSFDTPSESDEYELAKVICWNEDRSEGRVVWGRNQAEMLGQDSWVRWVYTFTAFNEPLVLPENMPE